MPDVVLTTLNAQYAHSAFGLRCLLANMGPLEERAEIIEFDIQRRPADAAETIMARNPKIVCIGVYVWNAAQSLALVSCLRRVRPDIIIVLGGPEVTCETDEQEICRLADFVVSGEGDIAFPALCARLLSGERSPEKIIAAEPPDLARLRLPYHLYDDTDIARRVLYVEASRGCPFGCEFCLSSLGAPVRRFPEAEFLAAMQSLLDRGALRFKFVDRTFNLDIDAACGILRFFLDRLRPGLFLHFEMVPDRLPVALRDLLKSFPPASVQIEAGVQTMNPEIAARIGRKQDMEKAADNLRFLREETGVHMHADLIAGLPGESLESFADGFDRLLALRPHEIQIEPLKRLRGTAIRRHDAEWGMVYSIEPPYEVLATRNVPFADMQRLKRFARYWDLVSNSGNFIGTAPLLWSGGSPFKGFMAFNDCLFARGAGTHGIALDRLAEYLFEFLTHDRGRAPDEAATAILHDYSRAGRNAPVFLRGLSIATAQLPRSRPGARTRQERFRGKGV